MRDEAQPPSWFRSVAARDIFVVVSLGTVAFAATVYFDLFSSFVEFARRHTLLAAGGCGESRSFSSALELCCSLSKAVQICEKRAK